MKMRRMQQFGGGFGTNPYKQQNEDLNPSSYLANLSDCMLVMVCGLLVALVTAWNVDLSNVFQVAMSDEMQEIEDVQEIDDTLQAGGETYSELGKVYQDQEGNLYMVQQTPSEGNE